MLQKLKERAMREATKLLSTPRAAQLMTNPRLMAAVMTGFELKGRMQSELESGLRALAGTLSLATRSDVENTAYALRQDLQQYLHDLEARCDRLELRVADAASSVGSEAGLGQSSG